MLKICLHVFNPQRPYSATHLVNSKPPVITLNGHKLAWVEQFRYLGHVLTCNLRDNVDIRRVKHLLYFNVNMLCAKVGYANKHILIKLFKSYCTNMYGCELWNICKDKKVFKELCEAYHSCIKRLVRIPVWSRNHPLCMSLKLLPCPMLVASRQLLFQQRLLFSPNSIIRSVVNSPIGRSGILANTHSQIRQEYDLVSLDLSAARRPDVSNVFRSHLVRVVASQVHLDARSD